MCRQPIFETSTVFFKEPIFLIHSNLIGDMLSPFHTLGYRDTHFPNRCKQVICVVLDLIAKAAPLSLLKGLRLLIFLHFYKSYRLIQHKTSASLFGEFSTLLI